MRASLSFYFPMIEESNPDSSEPPTGSLAMKEEALIHGLRRFDSSSLSST